MKIAVIGYSGSGKSTLATRLAGIYRIPLLYLDTVQFLPGWIERDQEEARSMVRRFMQNGSWIVDGNYYNFLQNERLEQADQILFLNFPRVVCLYRAYKRYMRYRDTTRESMTEGCNEKLDLGFIWWILHKGRTRKIRKKYADIERRYPHKTKVLRNQNQIDRFVRQVENSIVDYTE